MKRTLLFFTLAFVALTFQAFSQGRVVTGTVMSGEDNSPLPGVNVVIKGTSSGAITDIDGNYRITTTSNDNVLVFSYIGFNSFEATVGAQSVINVNLVANAEELSEVVVVGYGTQTKEELTGSVEIIGAERLEQLPATSFQAAIQGNAPGVQLVAADGAPGANFNVRVRGIGSINASNEPLYVIDGIPVTSGSLSETDFDNDTGGEGRSSNVMSSLNPNDIESLTILKDAASTAIYGSRGANGVVLITTKSGKSGKAKIDLKTQVGFNSFAFNNLLQSLNREQYTELYLEGWMNQGETLDEAQARFDNDFPENANTNWIEELTQVGVTQQYDLSATGGSDKFTYFVSGSYLDQEGTIIGTNFERYSSRLNLKAQLTEKLSLSNNLSLAYFTQKGMTDGTRWQAPFYVGYLMAPTIPVRDAQGRFYGDHASFFMGGNNPVGHLSGDDARELEQTRITNNFSASYDILENLTFKSSWSFDIINVDEFIFNNGRYGDGRNVGGTANEARTDRINWLGSQTLNYGKTFNEVHNFDVLLGYEAQKVTNDVTEASGEGFPHPDLRTLNSAANPTAAESRRTEFAFNSYFSRINYDYIGKYFLSASFRRDGSSRFGPDKRWGTFWSLGGSWNINEEGFLAGSDALNLLKLRTSYGVTGNAGLDGNFDWASLYGFSESINDENRQYDGRPGGAPSQVGNPVLTWESQENFNIGLDFGLFNKINGTVEYFIRTSSDLILERPLSYTTGFRNFSENIGDIRNSGVEISLNADIINSADFSLSLGGNISFINNEITKLPEPFINPDFNMFRLEEGRDIQEYFVYDWAGVNPDNGDPLWYTDETRQETTSNINEASQFYSGKSGTPDFFGGFNLSASYKGFSLFAQLNYQFGNYVYDNPGWVIHGDGRFTPRSTSVWAFENRWKAPGDQALFPRHVWGNRSASNQRNSSRFMYEGDFIRLRTVNLSYDIPATLTQKAKLRSLRVYAALNNFFTWVKDDNLHFDPEQAPNGIYNTVTPINKTVSLGVNIGI